MDPPLIVILKMLMLLVNNTIGTLKSMFKLFSELLASMFRVISIGGIPAMILSIVIMSVVVYFFFKFVFKSGKEILILMVVLTILIFLIGFSVVR